MIGKIITTTMRVLTIVLSVCGSSPSINIRDQASVMQRVKRTMSSCTNGIVKLEPIVYPTYVDICPYACDADAINRQVSELLTLNNEKYVMYVLPKEMQCSFAGLGSIGPCSGQPCNIWINGYYANYTAVYLHELGHNLGLGHANSNGYSYGDLTDAMGACCYERCFNAVHRNKLSIQKPKNWYRAPFEQLQTVTLDANEYVIILVGTMRYYVQNRQNDSYDQIPHKFGGMGLNVYVERIGQSEDSELLARLHSTNEVVHVDGAFLLTQTSQSNVTE